MDWKLELVFVPVSDVDRAKDFYVNKVGFNADFDERPMDGIRFVQLTPPGSACSIAIGGEGLSDAPPGTAPSSKWWWRTSTRRMSSSRPTAWTSAILTFRIGGHFVYFADPDGNKWAVQYLPQRPNG